MEKASFEAMKIQLDIYKHALAYFAECSESTFSGASKAYKAIEYLDACMDNLDDIINKEGIHDSSEY
jgi:hypothetical protein